MVRTLNCIAAVSQNMGIGKNGDLPWPPLRYLPGRGRVGVKAALERGTCTGWRWGWTFDPSCRELGQTFLPRREPGSQATDARPAPAGGPGRRSPRGALPGAKPSPGARPGPRPSGRGGGAGARGKTKNVLSHALFLNL